MEFLTLKPFQYGAQTKAFTLKCVLEHDAFLLKVRYQLLGPMVDLILPERTPTPTYRENLYEHTCFELFLMGKTEHYLEWNFSPNKEWALFAFDAYRKKSTQNLDIKKPWHEFEYVSQARDTVDLKVVIDLTPARQFLKISKQTTLKIGLSGVLENREGHLSYWALAHPTDKPDFHHEDSFSVMI